MSDAREIAELALRISELDTLLAAANARAASAAADRDRTAQEATTALNDAMQRLAVVSGERDAQASALRQARAAADAALTQAQKAADDYRRLSVKWDEQSDQALAARGIDRPYRVRVDGTVHETAGDALARLPVAQLMQAGIPEPAAMQIARDPTKFMAALGREQE